jgi:type I protein arginine methyltransferase
MYSVSAYGKMIADNLRVEAYTRALRTAIKPGSVVMDLGCGPGLFALIACRLGARRVYAVETESVITLAREAAAANGFANRIEFIENVSTEITLPKPAEIIVSDLRGVLPWCQQHIPSIIDARKRLLQPGGTLISRRDTVWAAIIEARDQYEEIIGPWEKNGFEFDLSAARLQVTNTWRKARIKPQQFLVEPRCVTTIDYYEVDNPNLDADISWRVEREGTAHGVGVWFDSLLIDGIGFSNHPSSPEMIYGNAFFPFSEPVEIAEGEHIKLRLAAKLIDDDYVWRWDTDFFAHAEERPKKSFKQSTFYGIPFSQLQLEKIRQ